MEEKKTTSPETFSPNKPTGHMSRSIPVIQGILAASGLMPLAVAHWIHGQPSKLSFLAILFVAITSCVLLLLGAATFHLRITVGRLFASFGIVGVVAVGISYLFDHPLAALFAMIGFIGSLNLIWHGSANQISAKHALSIRARSAAVTAFIILIISSFGRHLSPIEDLVALGFAWLVVGTLVGLWSKRYRKLFSRRVALLALALLFSIVIGVMLWGQWWHSISSFAIFVIAAIFVLPSTKESTIDYNGWWEIFVDHPERLFVGTFIALCLLGSIVLSLPQSAGSGQVIDYLNALFTSVSAVCVTGLIVVDTPVVFSLFGNLMILLLIQLGGLGIMTFSTMALRILGRRMSMRHEGAVAHLISHQHRGQLVRSARQILLFTFVTELAGVLCLFPAFIGTGDSLITALWRAIFTSVSAFCNAGFALQSNSLIPYQSHPFILHIVALLIIAGGISPVVVLAIPRILQGQINQISAQTKIILTVTLALLLGGQFFFMAFEWNNTLAKFSFFDRINNAWFQSVTLRTAGFNSVDIALVTPATLILMMVWMFIGGSPGGTAGGIKTTTFALLVLLVLQTIRGRGDIVVFRRSISSITLHKAAVVAALGLFAVIIATVALLLTQTLSTGSALFEVISAIGTVGLSLGGTQQLDGVGKFVIVACMFAGRVGPLTLLMFTGRRSTTQIIKRPDEAIDVG